jgi:hypothetical protein
MEAEMASFQATETGGARPEDEIVSRVGAAAGRVAIIQQEYTMQAEAQTQPDARAALASRARAEAERVLDEHGVSIQDYNAILTAAETDQVLEQRLLEAAREVM